MTKTYDFDEAFQKKVIAMSLRDEVFAQRVEKLVQPAFFDEDALGWLADLTNRHFETYRQIPTGTIVINELRKAKAAKLVKDDFVDEIKDVLKYVYGTPDLSNRDYTVEAVSAFAKERALEGALLQSADLMDKGEYESIRNVLAKALDTGSSDDLSSIDLLDSVAARVEMRIKKMAGTIVPSGISSGHKEIDAELYNSGWGRKELSCFMGGPKSGKSIALQYFAVKAAEAGENVLFITCENSSDITADRIDANVANVPMKELGTSAAKVEAAWANFKVKAGQFRVHEFPTNSLRCSDVRRLLRLSKRTWRC